MLSKKGRKFVGLVTIVEMWGIVTEMMGDFFSLDIVGWLSGWRLGRKSLNRKRLKHGTISFKKFINTGQSRYRLMSFYKKNICRIVEILSVAFALRGVVTVAEGRGVCARVLGGLWLPFPLLQFLNQKRSNSFSFKHQRYCFWRVLRNYMLEMFDIRH